jgi:pyruvate/2-oxoglutarate/acetoin dehydrogenase E1 component
MSMLFSSFGNLSRQQGQQAPGFQIGLTRVSGAENGFMGMGIGAAMTGLRVIIEGMNMGFLLLAYNQISNNAGMLHYTSGGQFKVQ